LATQAQIFESIFYRPPTPSSFDTNSPYVAMGVAAILITAILIIVIVRSVVVVFIAFVVVVFTGGVVVIIFINIEFFVVIFSHRCCYCCHVSHIRLVNTAGSFFYLLV
jgi:hypothetical protein